MLKPINFFVDIPLASVEESRNLVSRDENQSGVIERSFNNNSIPDAREFQPLFTEATPIQSAGSEGIVVYQGRHSTETQLSLLPSAPAEFRRLDSDVSLAIEPIRFPLAIAPHRFFITATQGDRRWAYPIQLSEVEARWMLPKLAALDWTLSDAGVPIYAADIHATVETLLGGAA